MRGKASVCLAMISLLLGGFLAAGANASSIRHGHRARHRAHHQHRSHHSRRARHHHRAHRTGAKAASEPGPTWSATAPCPNADTPAASATVAEMDASINCLINQQRLRFGLPPMDVSSDLNHSAQAWTDRMVATGTFTHGSDSAFSNRLLDAGFNWSEAGENIATGYLTPRDALAGWMASPDHCQNILDPDYRFMGTGENPAAAGNWASGPATWTQDFGLLMNQNPLSHASGPQNGCPYSVPASPGSAS